MQTESKYLRKALYPLVLITSFVLSVAGNEAAAHDIIFCGERIPVNNDFVANKLMNVIRKQIPNVNLPSLRQRALLYFPFVESFLKRSGLPADFKYLPIVESGFLVQTSGAGARGFWQLMPATAKDMGLVVSTTLDERDDINKSTMAACKVLSSYYTTIQKKHKVSSWILTAAAYNFGIGNIINAIQSQGKDYFTMNLNAETAVYVYKMIAVKELFEFPELYMKSFGYNVFGKGSPSSGAKGGGDNEAAFGSLSVKMGKDEKKIEEPKAVFVAAHIKGKYKDFKDGDLVTIEIDDNLVVQGGYTKKGSDMKAQGWIIDNKIYFDLGYGHDVLLYDSNGQKGLDMKSLRKGEPVLLKNLIYDDHKW